jgi:hypothetical protein
MSSPFHPSRLSLDYPAFHAQRENAAEESLQNSGKRSLSVGCHPLAAGCKQQAASCFSER